MCWHTTQINVEELLRLLRARNFMLLGKIVNLPSTAKLSKRKILPYSAENLQQSKAKPTSTNEESLKNVGKLLSTR